MPPADAPARSVANHSGGRPAVSASTRADPSHSFTGQLAGLLHPIDELRLAQLIVLVDIEIAHILLLGAAGGKRIERRPVEEGDLEISRHAVEAEEPASFLDPIKGRVPFDCLAHAGDGALDESVDTAPHGAFPARHGRNVSLHRS